MRVITLMGRDFDLLNIVLLEFYYLKKIKRGGRGEVQRMGGLAVLVGARAPSSWNAEGSVPLLPKGMKEKNLLGV